MKLLLIEDPDPLPFSLGPGLRRAGFSVDATTDCEVGLWIARSIDHDVMVVDLMETSIEGTTLLQRLLRQKRAPVLAILPKAATTDGATTSASGVDDCLVKPFAFDELLVRVQALCRRGFAQTDPRLLVGPLEIDLMKKTVRCDDEAIPLAKREFSLLEYLAKRRGELVTRSQIEEHLYAERTEPTSNAVDSAICILRKKLGHPLIQTRHGLGYILP